jgi:hypothetical protein
MLFTGATSSIYIQGGESESFEVERGVRQGCPLAPYLFLFIGEALNILTRRAVELEELEGITLPEAVTEQVLIQYADDADVMVRGTEHNCARVLSLLDSYGLATGLCINWAKSQVYWLSSNPSPPWLARLPCPWAVERQLSKLLGTPFGINLHTQDVDEFLYTKIQKKLEYWALVHLSLSGRAVIANSVLVSTLYYFITIWGGSRQVIRKIRAQIRNFLWLGSLRNCRARVRWTDCCAVKQVGGLGLVDPEEALLALAAKWIIRGLTPGTAPLQILIRYRLLQIRSHARGGWPMASQWVLTPRFQATRWSRAWTRIISAWRKLSPHLTVRPPINKCEVLTTHLWWSSSFIGGQFGFSHESAAHLMKNGLQQLGDIWDQHSGSFLSWHEAGIRYGLLPCDRQYYINLVAHIPLRWYNLLADQRQAAAAKEYLGLFATEDAEFRGLIFPATKDYWPSLEAGDRRFTLPAETPQFYLSSASMLLQPWLIQPPATEVTYDAYIKRVRIITTARGPVSTSASSSSSGSTLGGGDGPVVPP